jgi:succinyl-CoA synthetase beta subunit
MNIHEYQAKELLKQYKIAIQDGVVLSDAAAAAETITAVQQQFNTQAVVIKAQIHAGGRGKGGGVKFCPNTDSAKQAIDAILGMNLVTHQTGPEGQLVRKVLVAQALDIESEYYVAITLDRSTGCPVVMVSTEGGVDIETVAAETPEKITRVTVDPVVGLRAFQARHLAGALGLSGDVYKQAVAFFVKLYICYEETDASLIEVNPLVVTTEGQLVALDAKFNFDDNALYRQKTIAEQRDTHEEDPSEVEASKHNLNYVKLDGNVGCMVNGAGLAMATMDIIKFEGGEPANFLDVGGGANVETVKQGFSIILSDPNVKAILVNIFGGIVRCDRVANGIVQAVSEMNLTVPVVVRLEGTNADVAKTVLDESGVSIISATTLEDAAQKVVQAAS